MSFWVERLHRSASGAKRFAFAVTLLRISPLPRCGGRYWVLTVAMSRELPAMTVTAAVINQAVRIRCWMDRCGAKLFSHQFNGCL